MDEAADERVNVVLCWHLHQPQYRDPLTGQFERPWSYLHGMRDCIDLAVHLETVPEACAVVNFSPVLLDQLDDYCAGLAAHFRNGAPIPDRVLALLGPDGPGEDRQHWPMLARACLRAGQDTQVGRFPAYRALAERAAQMLRDATVTAAEPALLTDLAVWYHLAWLGETVRRGDPRVRPLLRRAGDFSTADRRQLLECIADVLSGLVPRYRRLAGNGQVELSISPWGHPVMPLLFDFAAAHEADPELVLPAAPCYPGGGDRARWHLARALQVFHRAFGLRPRGCWPAEGAISDATLAMLDGFGFDWTASADGVLRRSAGAIPAAAAHCGWRRGGQRLVCFFRHDELSERVGFEYSHQDGDAAAADLVLELERLAANGGLQGRNVISLVMDGLNAWESFPDGGYRFQRALYRRLAAHPRLRLSTFARCLQQGVEVRPLETLVAGSWIDGRLDTWIGNPERNALWQWLCDAKAVFDQVVVEGSLDEAGQSLAEYQLGVCEGSDWFWALPEANPGESAASFQRLFRRHLGRLYQLLDEAPPEGLDPGTASLAPPAAEAPASDPGLMAG